LDVPGEVTRHTLKDAFCYDGFAVLAEAG
jgi:hypothetical protein